MDSERQFCYSARQIGSRRRQVAANASPECIPGYYSKLS
jgi:hypothetical protein